VLWQPKSCPKCESDTFIYHTVSGNQYEECFRCGYRSKVEESAVEGSLGQAEGSALVNE